ncbi:MAG: DNA polymerase III subunit delta' [Anaerolineae bacterium]
MHNWPVFGHDWAVDYLRKGMLNNRVRHAYLITGTSSIGKHTFAHAFAMALNCLDDDIAARPCGVCRSCKRILSGNHIDLLYSETDSNTGALKIDAIRAVTNQIAMKPYDARYRIAIFEDFDRAQPRAQDALLKTLEEPPPHAILILIATSLESILPTITSRSQTVYLRPVASETIRAVLVNHYNTEPEQAKLLAQLSAGRIGWAIQAAQNPDMLDQREQALTLLEEAVRKNRAGRFDLAQDLGRDKLSLAPLLELWLSYWRDVLHLVENSRVELCNLDRETTLRQMTYDVSPEQARGAIQATQTMLGQLALNTNLRLALEVMFLDYPGLKR